MATGEAEVEAVVGDSEASINSLVKSSVLEHSSTTFLVGIKVTLTDNNGIYLITTLYLCGALMSTISHH